MRSPLRFLATAGLTGGLLGVCEAAWILWERPPLTADLAGLVLAWGALAYAAATVLLATAVVVAQRRLLRGRGADAPPLVAAPLVGASVWLAVAIAASVDVAAGPLDLLLPILLGAAAAVLLVALASRVLPPALDRPGPWLVAWGLAASVGGVACAAHYGGADDAPASDPPRRNVVLVTVDTLRADRLGAYGNARARTPAMDALAEEGVLFEEAYTVSPFTCPSHATLLTGLDPFEHGAWDNATRIRRETPGLPDRLRALGWETAAFVSAAPLRHRVCGLGDRFGLYEDRLGPWRWLPQETRDLAPVRLALPLLERIGPFRRRTRSAEETLDAALGWLEERPRERPFFLWLHFFDPHLPYTPPAPFDTLFDPDYEGPATGHWYWIGAEAREQISSDPEDLAHMVALYDGEVAYVDTQIARLREALARQGLDESTLVVLTSDHGESHGEHQRYFARGLYRPSLQVPLILGFPPGEVTPRRVAAPVRSLDLAPSLLDWLGVAGAAAGETQGWSFLPLARGEAEPPEGEDERPLFAVYPETALHANAGDEVAVQRRGLKLIRRSGWWYGDGLRVEPGEELYDLDADPEERHNLLNGGPPPPQAEELRADLERWGARRAEPRRPDEDLQEMLRALGYAQ